MPMNFDGYFKQGSLLADVLDRVSAYAKLVKMSFGSAVSQERVSTKSQKLKVLEQTLYLNVNTLASARRAATVMMPRLAPMKEDQLVWDISGPRADTEILNTDNKSYSLGFVKTNDLEKWHVENPEQDAFSSPAKWGGKYKFRSPANLVTKRKKTLSKILGFGFCYMCVILVGVAWAGRPNQVLSVWQNQMRQVKIETAQAGEDTQNLIARKKRIEQYQASVVASSLLKSLAVLSQALPEGGWISAIRYDKGKIRIHGFTDNPANLAAVLEVKPFVKRVQLGPISMDRISGLQRFVLTLTLADEGL